MPRRPRQERPPKLSKEEKRAEILARRAAWKAMTPAERLASLRAAVEARRNAQP